VRVTRWIAIGLAAVAAAAALFLFWPSEERQVRKRLEALAEAASVPAHESDLARLARAQRFRGWLREDVRVAFEQAEWPPIEGRDAVAALVLRPWVQAAGGLRVELEGLSISLGDGRSSADARFKARILRPDPDAEPVVLDGRMVSVTLQRVEGEWLVASARIMRSDDAASAYRSTHLSFCRSTSKYECAGALIRRTGGSCRCASTVSPGSSARPICPSSVRITSWPGSCASAVTSTRADPGTTTGRLLNV
jgi:hypothetical protein